MSISAMKQALEALVELNEVSKGPSAICLPASIDTAMDALRQAIAEAEKQEPVAWIRKEELAYMSAVAGQGIFEWKVNLGLKPQAGDVGLYLAPVHAIDMSQECVDETVKGEHEPVASTPEKPDTWVGLTDEEKYDVLEGATGDGGRVYYDTLFRSYEAKLKEKNCPSAD